MELMCLDEHLKSANNRMKKPLSLIRLNEIATSLDKVRRGLGNSDVGQCRRLITYMDLVEEPTKLLNYK
jgi:hypothetical protein